MTMTDPTPSEFDAAFAHIAAQLADLRRLALGGAGGAGAGTFAIPSTGHVPDVTDGALIETAWGNAIRDRAVERYDTYAQLKSQLPSPADGAVALTLDDGRVYYRRAARWYTRATGQIASIASDVGGTINLTAALVTLDAITGGSAAAGFNADKTVWGWAEPRYNASPPGSIQLCLFKCSTATGGTVAIATNTTITTLSYDVTGYRT